MHTLVSKLVALGVEKNYMALTKIQLKTCRFHGSCWKKLYGSHKNTIKNI